MARYVETGLRWVRSGDLGWKQVSHYEALGYGPVQRAGIARVESELAMRGRRAAFADLWRELGWFMVCA